MRTIANILWIVFGGLIAAGAWVIIGGLFYLTIIGIPLGRQAMKMASLTLAPFGRTVVWGGGTPSLVANIIWLAFAGVPMAFGYCMVGVMLCCTTSVLHVSSSSGVFKSETYLAPLCGKHGLFHDCEVAHHGGDYYYCADY